MDRADVGVPRAAMSATTSARTAGGRSRTRARGVPGRSIPAPEQATSIIKYGPVERQSAQYERPSAAYRDFLKKLALCKACTTWKIVCEGNQGKIGLIIELSGKEGVPGRKTPELSPDSSPGVVTERADTTDLQHHTAPIKRKGTR